MSNQPYATDLTDAEWAILSSFIPEAKPGGHSRTVKQLFNNVSADNISEITLLVSGGEKNRPLVSILNPSAAPTC
jgi:hypothetical protein